METDAILRRLVGMETDTRASDPDGRSCVVVQTEWDGRSAGESSTSEALSLPEALDLLAAKIFEHENLLTVVDEDANPLLSGIRKPQRAALAQVLLGLQDNFESLAGPPAGNPVTEEAVRSLPGVRPIAVVVDSHTWGREFTLMILETAPTGVPTIDELALLDAAARGDAIIIDAALLAGASVDVLDTEGMTPLHHAVAHRAPEAVEALIQAGADARAQAEFGNSVCFAGLDEQGRVRPRARRIEDNLHGGILVELVEAGAEVNARDPFGRTLVDLAIASVPYPEQIVAYLRDRGGQHATRATRALPELLRDLAPGDFGEQAVRVNEVQYRLEREDPGTVADTLHWMLGPEWTEDEVGAETLFELTHLLLSNGAKDTSMAGWKPLDRAYDLFANGKRPQYQVVTYRLRKAGFTRTVRGMLKWIPDGDVPAQRALVGEVRERLASEGPQPDALHWLLAPHGWLDSEVCGEVLAELVDVLLDNGAQNTLLEGRTPLDWAKLWADREGHEQYGVVVERLEAAGFHGERLGPVRGIPFSAACPPGGVVGTSTSDAGMTTHLRLAMRPPGGRSRRKWTPGQAPGAEKARPGEAGRAWHWILPQVRCRNADTVRRTSSRAGAALGQVACIRPSGDGISMPRVSSLSAWMSMGPFPCSVRSGP